MEHRPRRHQQPPRPPALRNARSRRTAGRRRAAPAESPVRSTGICASASREVTLLGSTPSSWRAQPAPLSAKRDEIGQPAEQAAFAQIGIVDLERVVEVLTQRRTPPETLHRPRSASPWEARSAISKDWRPWFETRTTQPSVRRLRLLWCAPHQEAERTYQPGDALPTRLRRRRNPTNRRRCPKFDQHRLLRSLFGGVSCKPSAKLGQPLPCLLSCSSWRRTRARRRISTATSPARSCSRRPACSATRPRAASPRGG